MPADFAPIPAPNAATHHAHPASTTHPLPFSTPKALGLFFLLAARAPRAVHSLGPLASRIVPLAAPRVRDATRLNAARIFGRPLSNAEQRAFTREVVSSFYQFVTDVGQSTRATPPQIRARIEVVHGETEYLALRRARRGAVLVTAHMGSFEVGLAALTSRERRVHVVYKRDASGPFESMRSRLRRLLDVAEAPIDRGLPTWMALRAALLDDQVVVMQADRAMPGQRSALVPFLSGHLRVPTGAARLARLTGSPIVPVFTVRLPSRGFAVHLLHAIDPAATSHPADAIDPAVFAITKSIESMVAAFPTQWLVLAPAFDEDAVHA